MSEERSIREIRLEKLERMRALGHDPYSVERFDRSGSAKELLDGFQEGREVAFAGRVVSYRLMGKAGFAHVSDGDGKIQGYFKKDDLGETGWELYNLLDIGDHIGVRGELFVTKTGEKSIHVRELIPLSKSLQTLPMGKVREGQHWYGLTDVEQRYRHRHLDLVCNADARRTLVNRSKIVSAVRRFMDSKGYLEVETPLLQVVAGGAAARPFVTHYNAYEMEVKLRISLELYLKRLIAGDLPKVYEIGRVFRNEGVSNRHNPEFSLLEFYEAYANLEDIMRLVEEMFAFVAIDVFGSPVVRIGGRKLSERNRRSIDPVAIIEVGEYAFARFELPSGGIESSLRRAINPGDDMPMPHIQGVRLTSGKVDMLQDLDSLEWIDVQSTAEILLPGLDAEVSVEPGVYVLLARTEVLPERVMDFGKPWRRVDLLSEIERLSGLTGNDLSSLENAQRALGHREVVNPATGKRIMADAETNLGGLIEKLLEVFVEPTLQEPTFVVGYPIETSPLAKKDPKNPKITRRFEGYVLGREMCNAFSEINDPIDQLERFHQQQAELSKGDEEAHPMDEEFVYALESGMPPTGGCGIGMERMAMVLTGAEHIREVLLFPMMKPREAGE